MKVISSGKIKGEIAAPPSKSMMQRAVIAATLAPGKTKIVAPSYSDDGKASLRVSRALGSSVSEHDNEVIITGGGKPTGAPLNCGESGTSIRMFAAVAGLYSSELVLEGEGSLATRPMRMIEAPLAALGATVTLSDGHAPIKIKGPIRGGAVVVDGSMSSQFISGLLLALPACKEDSVMIVPELKSKPYVLMTLELLRDFGIKVTHDAGLSEFQIPGKQSYKPITYTVEGDWSGASFPLVAGAIAGEITVTNLRSDSLQADRAIMEALKMSGASVSGSDNRVTVAHRELKAFAFDATECPDLFPPLVALASQCAGRTAIRGAKRLTHKESDRGMALQKEFGTLGIDIEIDGDVLTVTGGEVGSGTVSSHNDHRIAMACALAGLVGSGPVNISQPECVAKSYPDFFEVLSRVQETA